VTSRSPVWAVFLLFACLYLLSIGRGFYSSDGEVMFKTTAALVERGAFALAPDPGLPQIVRGQGGRYYGKYDPGLPLIGVPFYVTGDWIGQINHAHRARLAATFYLLIPALAAAGALAALAAIARRGDTGAKALTPENTDSVLSIEPHPLHPPLHSKWRGGFFRGEPAPPFSSSAGERGPGGIGVGCYDPSWIEMDKVETEGTERSSEVTSTNPYRLDPDSVPSESPDTSREPASTTAAPGVWLPPIPWPLPPHKRREGERSAEVLPSSWGKDLGWGLICGCSTGRCSQAWLWAVLAAGLATPLWVYGRVLFAEAVLAWALTVAVMAVSFAPSVHADRRLLWLFVGGAAFGIGVLTRAALAIYTPALALLIVRRAGTRQPRANALRLGTFAAGALPFVLLVLGHNALRFGNPFEFGYAGEGFTTPPWKGIAGLLASPGKGIALYAPPLVLSAILWRRFRRAGRALADFLALAWVTALVVYGAWWAWDGGWCWGPRLLVPLMPLSCLPLTVLPDRRAWQVALVALVAAGIVVQVSGVLTTVVPHYAALAGNGTSGLDRIDFVPRDSPLVDAVRRLLHGQTEPLAMFHLGDTGLPPTWTVGVPLLLIAGAISGAYSLVRQGDR
jgi:hypothetical protein